MTALLCSVIRLDSWRERWTIKKSTYINSKSTEASGLRRVKLLKDGADPQGPARAIVSWDNLHASFKLFPMQKSVPCRVFSHV